MIIIIKKKLNRFQNIKAPPWYNIYR